MKNIKRIGIYIRVSTEEQAKIVEGSLVSQRKRLEIHPREARAASAPKSCFNLRNLVSITVSQDPKSKGHRTKRSNRLWTALAPLHLAKEQVRTRSWLDECLKGRGMKADLSWSSQGKV